MRSRLNLRATKKRCSVLSSRSSTRSLRRGRERGCLTSRMFHRLFENSLHLWLRLRSSKPTVPRPAGPTRRGRCPRGETTRARQPSGQEPLSEGRRATCGAWAGRRSRPQHSSWSPLASLPATLSASMAEHCRRRSISRCRPPRMRHRRRQRRRLPSARREPNHRARVRPSRKVLTRQMPHTVPSQGLRPIQPIPQSGKPVQRHLDRRAALYGCRSPRPQRTTLSSTGLDVASSLRGRRTRNSRWRSRGSTRGAANASGPASTAGTCGRSTSRAAARGGRRS